MNKQIETKKPVRILMIEDSEDDCELIQHRIRSGGYKPYIKRIETREELNKTLNNHWDIILCDHKMPQFDGVTALKMIREKNPDIPFLLISGTVSEKTAVSAMREGANDYLFKDNLQRLVPAIDRELKDSENRKKKREAEEKIRQNELKLRQAHKLARLGYWELNLETRILTFSDELLQILNIEQDQMHLQDFLKIIHPEDRKKILNGYKQIKLKQASYGLIFRVKNSFHRIKHFHCRCKLTSDKYRPEKLRGTLQDITRQVESKSKLEKALHEKKLLLAEMHHRVKNNMATISSLLELERFSTENDEAQKILSRNIYRIKNMALIQEMLYKSNDFSHMSFGIYLQKLLNKSEELHYQNKDIKFTRKLEDVELGITQALPAALIVNELITNAYKHAFKNQDTGSINLSLKREGSTVKIVVEDDGCGFHDNLNLNNGVTLGYTLINTLADQLNGTLNVTGKNGTRAVLEFDIVEKSDQNKLKKMVS